MYLYFFLTNKITVKAASDIYKQNFTFDSDQNRISITNESPI